MSNDKTIVGNTEIILADQMWAIFWSAPRRFCIGGAVLVVALIAMGAVAAYREDMEGVPVIIAVVVCLLIWPTLVALFFFFEDLAKRRSLLATRSAPIRSQYGMRPAPQSSCPGKSCGASSKAARDLPSG
jgi:hypothetical protein